MHATLGSQFGSPPDTPGKAAEEGSRAWEPQLDLLHSCLQPDSALAAAARQGVNQQQKTVILSKKKITQKVTLVQTILEFMQCPPSMNAVQTSYGDKINF